MISRSLLDHLQPAVLLSQQTSGAEMLNFKHISGPPDVIKVCVYGLMLDKLKILLHINPLSVKSVRIFRPF